MNGLDIVILFILGISVLFGVIKGLIRELLSIAFFVVAVVLAFLFYQDVGQLFMKSIKNNEVSNFAGFLTIFFVVIIIGSIITYTVKKVFIVGPLKPIDRVLGGVFGLIRGILIAGVIVFGLTAFPVKTEWRTSSKLSPHVVKTIDVFYGLFPEKYKEKLKFIKAGQK